MLRSPHSQDASGQRRYASSPSAPPALALFGSILHLALTAGNSGALPPSGLFGDELSRIFGGTPNVHPPVDNPASVVLQPAAAYDSRAALSTLPMHGYRDVAHPDAMHQASPSHLTSLPVAHDYYPFTLSGFGALSSPSGQMHAMHEHTYGSPALGTHDYAGDELTPAYLPFKRMGSEATQEEEGNLPREVLPRYFFGEHARPLDVAEINTLIMEGKAMIQRVHERTKSNPIKTSSTGLPYRLAAGDIRDVNWMQRVFEARMRRFLSPNEFNKYDPIVMAVDKKPNNLVQSATRMVKEQQEQQGHSNNIAALRRALGPFDRTINPLSDFTFDGIHFHVLKKQDWNNFHMPSGNFRVVAVFPPNEQHPWIFMFVGKLSIKNKGAPMGTSGAEEVGAEEIGVEVGEEGK
ncbi:hypothetical protein ACQY0O_008153 [Thecaphora frezii]